MVFLKKDYGKIPESCTIVDIDANIGAFSIYAAGHSRSASIYSFEPMTSNFELMTENINTNGFAGRIKSFPLGVAGRAGKRKLYLAGSPFHNMYGENNGQSVDIDCVTLSDIFIINNIDKIDLLKVDCEGAEFEIFYNLADEYFSKIKDIRMEYHNQTSSKNNIGELKGFLQEKGFSTVFFRKDSNNSGNIWLSRA